ncbi:MAG: glycosyltransferase [Candidatus Magasanikbacteria bacterium]
MKIALVHDYLSQDGGAERVLKAMHELWPEAPIFVLFHDQKRIPYFNRERIHESFLAKLPWIKTNYQWYLPWMPQATENHDLCSYDVVLSSSSVFAKGIITGPNTMHISYCHTPPRFLWADTHTYMADLKYNLFIKSFLPGIIHRMRLWDKMSADRVDHFIANSKTVAGRISKYYRRDSDIIYPPVETHKFTISPDLGNYFLAGGRLVPYKRLDLVVKTFNRLKWPLIIFGDGSEKCHLQKYAKANIQFVGQISDEYKTELMSRALAFIHPQTEDCGITAIEAMASGRPVIAYEDGGATETIIAGETGIFFKQQKWETLLDTLLNFNPNNWNTYKIREHALRFGTNNFKPKIKKLIGDRWEEFKKGWNQQPLLR